MVFASVINAGKTRKKRSLVDKRPLFPREKVRSEKNTRKKRYASAVSSHEIPKIRDQGAIHNRAAQDPFTLLLFRHR